MARTALCFGDSNTWGYSPDDGERFAPDVRWPGVLAAGLGGDWRVIEEGLNGRTSAFDDPLDPILNGKTFLPVCLATHAPIDVVVIMLGTNDVFLPQGVTAHYAAAGVGVLADMVLASVAGPGGAAPAVLVVVPPPLAPMIEFDPAGPTALAQSRLFSESFRLMTAERGLSLVDLAGVVESSPVDGVHFDPRRPSGDRRYGRRRPSGLSRQTS